jgi:hypothetical protein
MSSCTANSVLFHRLSVATDAAIKARSIPRESTINPSNAAARGQSRPNPKARVA